jgi:hypothetical protein
MSQSPKKCNCCGKVHDAQAWDALPLVGRQDDGVELLELRNCTCRSTIAIAYGPSGRATLEPKRSYSAFPTP